MALELGKLSAEVSFNRTAACSSNCVKYHQVPQSHHVFSVHRVIQIMICINPLVFLYQLGDQQASRTLSHPTIFYNIDTSTI